MKKLFLLLVVSALGLALAAWFVVNPPGGNGPANQPLPRWKPPFPRYIAGTGLITPTPRKLVIRPLESGVVSAVSVKVGQQVTRGALLFKLDDSDLLTRLPRLRAAVEEARADVASKRHDLDYVARLHKGDSGYVSKKRFTDAQDALALALARLKRAEAELESLQRQRERRLVRAPADGRVLRFDLQPGDYAEASQTAPERVILATGPLQLRGQINQFDAWRFDPAAAAVAWLPDHPDKRLQLRFDHVEPYIVPKTALTGSPTERTDTRVLVVVYDLAGRPDMPVYAGEQFDLFIEAK